MSVRRFFNWLQLHLHLLGMHEIAMFCGRFGTPALESDVDPGDRPTIPYGEYEPVGEGDLIPDEVTTPRWSLDELPDTGPLEVLNFDNTFRENSGIDVTADIAFPTSEHDIN